MEIDEEMFCHLLGGGTISLSLVIGRTGYQRGEERLVAELYLSDGWEPLRSMLMAAIVAYNRDKNGRDNRE